MLSPSPATEVCDLLAFPRDNQFCCSCSSFFLDESFLSILYLFHFLLASIESLVGVPIPARRNFIIRYSLVLYDTRPPVKITIRAIAKRQFLATDQTFDSSLISTGIHHYTQQHKHDSLSVIILTLVVGLRWSLSPANGLKGLFLHLTFGGSFKTYGWTRWDKLVDAPMSLCMMVTD